ncbi:inorganic diphosphatase [Streptomyces sp. NPDC052051]|uniref:inorganic diphosphatase n=1 Tax=Streptomyces sp. NPDC052051 TaxID=3154649 RepID=UPI003425E22E
MLRITVDIDATASSALRTVDDVVSGRLTSGGWPVGHGHIPDTLDEGQPLDALVLMPEPALPGAAVPALPLAVLHLAAPRPLPVAPVVLCVAEDPRVGGSADTDDPAHRPAALDAWAAVLTRLRPRTPCEVTDCGTRSEAEHLLADAHHAYERLTGCLD